MRFGKKLLAAIERGEWVRRRNWHKGFKMRKSRGGCFVDEEGLIGSVGATEVLAKDWVIVRKKAKAPVADGRRYEPIETMPIVGDRIEHPDNVGEADAESLRQTVHAIQEHGSDYLWVVEANGLASLGSEGYGWRILKRRNVFADPKPGDVIGRAGATLEVRFVDTDAVLFRWNSGSFCAVGSETWASHAASGWTVRKLGA